MKLTRKPAHAVLLCLATCLTLIAAGAQDKFQDTFDVRKSDFASTGRNAYFVLEPGFQSTFEGTEDGEKAKLIITVLPETRQIDGVETRVIEERESANDELKEVSRNFFAIDKTTSDIYYFGEEVDTYKDGKVAGHGGSWQSGKDGAHYGLFMPAKPQVGQKFYQELAPKHAMDRCEIVKVDETVEVPAGKFKSCVKIEETTPLEPDAKEYKLYGPDAGLLIDGSLKLVKYGMKS